jgi:hypothetical protein
LLWFGSCNHCILACFLWSNKHKHSSSQRSWCYVHSYWPRLSLAEILILMFCQALFVYSLPSTKNHTLTITENCCLVLHCIIGGWVPQLSPGPKYLCKMQQVPAHRFDLSTKLHSLKYSQPGEPQISHKCKYLRPSWQTCSVLFLLWGSLVHHHFEIVHWRP